MRPTEFHSDALANDFALFCDNVRRVEAWRDLFSKGPSVSALTVHPGEASLESIVKASTDVLLAGHGHLASSRLWIFLAHGPWQNDTRLAHYWKIWRYLGGEGIVWPESQRGAEIAVRSPTHVRYATTGLVDSANLYAAMTVTFRPLCTSFMLLSEDDLLSESEVLGLFNTAFPRLGDGSCDTYVDWGRLIQVRVARGDVIIKRAGLFDDRKWSLDLFGPPDVLLPLLHHNRLSES